MKLITQEIQKAFEKQGATAEKGMAETYIICKFFNPSGAGTWYIYERDPNDPDIMWAFVNMGHPLYAECGTVSLSDLESLRFPPFGLPIERDTSVHPFKYTLEHVFNTIKRGGHV